MPGIKLYMQPVQDLTVDDRVSRTEYQYTLEDPNQNELNAVVHDLCRQAQATAANWPTWSPINNWAALAESLIIDRATASRFGITPPTIDNTLYDAFGQRQINTMYTQLNQYHVILETDPKFQIRSAKTERHLHPVDFDRQLAPQPAASNTAGSSSGAGSGSCALRPAMRC